LLCKIVKRTLYKYIQLVKRYVKKILFDFLSKNGLSTNPTILFVIKKAPCIGAF